MVSLSPIDRCAVLDGRLRSDPGLIRSQGCCPRQDERLNNRGMPQGAFGQSCQEICHQTLPSSLTPASGPPIMACGLSMTSASQKLLRRTDCQSVLPALQLRA